jgi:hypothetical protein
MAEVKKPRVIKPKVKVEEPKELTMIPVSEIKGKFEHGGIVYRVTHINGDGTVTVISQVDFSMTHFSPHTLVTPILEG